MKAGQVDLDKYEVWLKRSRAQKTVKCYVGQAREFLRWIGRRKISGKALDDYITFLAEEGKSQNTVATYYRWLCSLYRFLDLDVELKRVDTPHFKKADIKCPTKEEVDQLVAAAVKPLERALVMVQFGAGLRVGELRRLNRSDIIINDDGTGVVMVKSLKDRDGRGKVGIPVSKGVIRAVMQWLNTRDDNLEPLFPSKHAREGIITSEAIQAIYKRLCKRAGVPEITTHQLRHAYTTWLLLQGVSRSDIMKLCRWKDVRSIEPYDHVIPTDISSRVPDPFPDDDGGDEDEA